MTPPKDYELGTFHGLWQLAQDRFAETGGWPPHGNGPKGIVPGQRTGPVGILYCPHCGDERRMFISEMYIGYRAFYPSVEGGVRRKAELSRGGVLHAVLRLWCAQCDTAFTAVMYDGPNGPDSLCLLPSTFGGGGATPNSPNGVRFYCDQASRAASVGAYTAALPMLRSAIEVVLGLHDFNQNMIGPKLAALEKAINAGTAPPWVQQYDHEFLVVLKKLGNDALHTNADEITALVQTQDEGLYREAEIAIAQLMDVIYERPARETQRLAKLKNSVLPRPQK